MIAGWAVVLTALVYLTGLFAVAHFGDAGGRRWIAGPARATIYAFALAVYCTSWTFYGSVGLATRSGFDFLAVYLGPVIMIGLGHRLVRHVVRLARSQNSTSIADFIAARFGKSQAVAAIVTIVAVIGSVPYIALQLKAISASLAAMIGAGQPAAFSAGMPPYIDLALIVAMMLAFFAIAFGTRHVDATEHQDGLILAIAMESVVKLFAFLLVGITVVFGVFGGFQELGTRAAAAGAGIVELAARTSDAPHFLTITVIAAFAALLLPRQFHVAIVENRDEQDVKRGAAIFTLYLVAINLFVVPLAMAGLTLFPDGGADRDMTVLALPLAAGYGGIATVAFIGGLSAATAMVIVECVALSIMISNDLIVPALVRRRLGFAGVGHDDSQSSRRVEDLGAFVLIVRRLAIPVLLLFGYSYYRAAGEAALASIGLISFAAIAQIAPVFFGGLIWRRATSLGATAGLLVGLAVWSYTLLLPSLANLPEPLASIVRDGAFGISALRPTALFGVQASTLTHGVFFSLSANILAFVTLSLVRPVTTRERVQASAFIGPDHMPVGDTLRLWRTTVTIGELKTVIARYLGDERTRDAFAGLESSYSKPLRDDQEADIRTIHFGEHLLSSAIGAASSRLVLSLMLRRRNVSRQTALRLLDDASAALQYSRDTLQNALDHARQGITVFDRDNRLIAWNREFAELYELPPEFLRVGVTLDEIIRFNARQGAYGEGDIDALVARRAASFLSVGAPSRLRLEPQGRAIEIRSSRIPDGGMITTYADISDQVAAEEALERANETLERRVKERTEELERVNGELSRAKATADEANLSKTRFLAAASHDILQPLNAARLYAASLVERDRRDGDPVLARNVDGSLEAVEEILTTLLEISRLDAGALHADWTTVRLSDVFAPLQREFGPLAAAKGLSLRFVRTSLAVRSDRRLLRRLLQNLVSNAIKYTPAGRVLVGCRRRGGRVGIEVWDTGLGIPADKQQLIFREFQRLDQGARTARGLGLGLSIVDRISRVIEAPVGVESVHGKGSVFRVEVGRVVAAPAASPADETVATPDAPLAGLEILSIDNEPTILDGMRALLGGWGCSVSTASGLDEALSVVARTRPAVIIADYHLDEGDGLGAIAALRASLGGRTPAVLLTADRSPEVREEAHNQNVHVLNKPLKPAALRALLAQWRVTRMAAE